MKKILILSICIALIFTMTGCSNEGDEKSLGGFINMLTGREETIKKEKSKKEKVESKEKEEKKTDTSKVEKKENTDKKEKEEIINSKVEQIEIKDANSILDEETKSITITARANNKINKYDELLSESRSPEYYKTFMNQNKKALGFNYNLRFYNLTKENEPLKHIYCFSDEDDYGIDIYENDVVYERWFDITINGGIDGTGKEKVFYKIVKDEFKVDLLNLKEYVDGIKLIEKGDIEELELVISNEEDENTYYTISVVKDGGEYGYLFGYSRKYRIE